jgi:hypothetical protein
MDGLIPGQAPFKPPETHMIRTVLATAAALFAAGPLFVSPAAACISCEYTPEVVNTPVPGAKKHKRAVVKERPAKKRAVQRAKVVPKAPEPETYTAAKKPAPAPVEARADAQGAGDATETPSGTEAKPIEEAKAPEDVGCKRFSPTAGRTVPVPCN